MGKFTGSENDNRATEVVLIELMHDMRDILKDLDKKLAILNNYMAIGFDVELEVKNDYE